MPAASSAVQKTTIVISGGIGILLLIGLWTPFAGATVALIEFWLAFSDGQDFLLSMVLTTITAGLVMIGPGAWSIDARLFGRKRIVVAKAERVRVDSKESD